MTLKERLLETIATLPDDYVEETLQFVQTLQSPIRKIDGRWWRIVIREQQIWNSSILDPFST